MNCTLVTRSTVVRAVAYAGAGLAGLATSCVLASPALAIRPDPAPAGQHVRVYESDIIDADIAAHRAGQTAPPASGVRESTTNRPDWSALATGFGGGAMVTGLAVAGTQVRRRQSRPA